MAILRPAESPGKRRREHDPLVCGLDYETDCDRCRAPAIEASEIDGKAEKHPKTRQQKIDSLRNGTSAAVELDNGDPEPEAPERKDKAESPENRDGDQGRTQSQVVPEVADDPDRLARLHRRQNTDRDLLGMLWYRDEFYVCTGAAYMVRPGGELRAEVHRTVKDEFNRLAIAQAEIARREAEEAGGAASKDPPKPKPARKVTGKLVGDVRLALASMTMLPGTVEPPAWLKGEEPFPAAEALVCRNGILNVPAWLAGQGGMHPLTPRLFSTSALDFDFLPKAPQPEAWLRFLGELWPEDKSAVQLLQEWFGYCLLCATHLQKILLIVGPKRSGKGTIARVLRGLVGVRNYVAPTLAGLSLPFGLWPLVGKTVAVVSDARLSGRTDAAVVAERLLSISGEDPQTIDRKFLSSITCKLAARFAVLTNELPRFGDASGALAGRFLILRLTRSFYGKEDPALTERLLAELPGILLWALEGLRSLRERGRFEQPESAKQLAQELEDLSSPIGAFVRDCCEIGSGYEVETDALYERWKTWCVAEGRKDPGEKSVFGRNLRAAVPGLDDCQRRDGEIRWRMYRAIRLQEQPAPTPKAPW